MRDTPGPRSRGRWLLLVALPVAVFVVGFFAAEPDYRFDWPWWLWLLAAAVLAGMTLEGLLRHMEPR
jgi:4-amino-4-deoxy-L-arabinose transferase-like glycosyltransferase